MKERPILFSGEMVRAILDGRKTQTRRVVKPQPFIVGKRIFWSKKKGHSLNGLLDGNSFYGAMADSCPYGQSGDRLWVRETHYATNGVEPLSRVVLYKADNQCEVAKWTPSIHMRKEYSRINLEITNIRVERLQDISEEDAEAEGCKPAFTDYLGNIHTQPMYKWGYKRLWESINGFGSWDKNPWVWVVEFRRVL